MTPQKTTHRSEVVLEEILERVEVINDNIDEILEILRDYLAEARHDAWYAPSNGEDCD